MSTLYKIVEKCRTGSAWKRWGGEGGGVGEMVRTMYAHVNKRIKKNMPNITGPDSFGNLDLK
jgi:hypothetical protein